MTTAPFILLLFVFLAIIIALAWRGHYRLSTLLFVFFLIAFMLVFWHHVSDTLAINL
jgi:hypothetical protein